MMTDGGPPYVRLAYCAWFLATAVVGACGGRYEVTAVPAGERAIMVIRGQLLASDPELIARVAIGSNGVAPFQHCRREVTLWSAPEPAFWMTTIFGTTPEFFQIRRWNADRGALFDNDAGEVAVLGRTVAQQLFATSDPIGQSIRIRGQPFRVVGVLAARGLSSADLDDDDAVYLPLPVYERQVGAPRTSRFGGAVLVAAAPDAIGRLRMTIRQALREYHRLPVEADDDFSFQTLSESHVAP